MSLEIQPSNLNLHFEWTDDTGKVWKTAEFLLFKDLLDCYQEIVQNKKVSCRFYYTIGSRSSAKTHSFMIFICMLFLIPEKQVIIYIFRKTDRMLNDFRIELFNKLQTYFQYEVKNGTGGNYNANEKILRNCKSAIIFKALNHEKMRLDSGGSVGLPVWEEADVLVGFFEEISQLDEKLVSITKQSLKGGAKTQILQLHASNPWSPVNWYVKRLNNWLPEDEDELLNKGYQKRIFYDTNLKQNVFVLRNNVLTNPFLSEDNFNELNSHKQTDINFWKVVFLGIAGTLGSTIYAHNLKLLKNIDWNEVKNQSGFFQGGVDWGDGASAGASPSSCHFGKISNNTFKGLSILNEKTIWNNKGTKHTTNEQVDEIIKFFKQCYEVYKKPFKVFVDCAALSDFQDMFNARLCYHQLTVNQIEFCKCIKVPIEKRIEVLNWMIANDYFRVEQNSCPDLMTALHNSHWVEVKEEREGFKRVRNHDETHWINSVEYLLDSYVWDFANLNRFTEK